MYLLVSSHDLSFAVFGLVGREDQSRSQADAPGLKVVEVSEVKTRPEGILEALLNYLHEHELEPEDLEGIVVVVGPGSSTALRAGLSVVNTIAFVQKLPVLSLSNAKKKPLKELLASVDLWKTDIFALPYYEREPHITKQRR